MINRTFKSDYTFSEADLYTSIIVQHPEVKCDATQVEIDDTRYVSCLSVVPLVMDATSIFHGYIIANIDIFHEVYFIIISSEP